MACRFESDRAHQQNEDRMYKVHHIFPSTGEWASTLTDTLEEAESWFRCKSQVSSSLQSIVTLYDKDDNILKQQTVGQ